jgi:hypothetical protein
LPRKGTTGWEATSSMSMAGCAAHNIFRLIDALF